MTQTINGDCLEVLKTLADNSIDSVVTDPPYGISFMGKKWDYDVPKVEVWSEVYRVLKPGGHILVACGTRTQHRMAVNIEDAGFEIRDIVSWIYGSGFPKSLNIGKAVDKLRGNKREDLGESYYASRASKSQPYGQGEIGAKDERRFTKGTSEWEGWGTALKPSMELWTLARKPLSEKTVAENVLKWGTGGINIDGSRVETTDKYSYPNGAGGNSFSVGEEPDGKRTEPVESNNLGRFPANLIHDGLEEDWARYFYCAKASKAERNRGLEEFEEKKRVDYGGFHSEKGLIENGRSPESRKQTKNNHPTVKPVALMKYLCKLITPPQGVVLDPFMGSGTTGIAAKEEGFKFIGIEREQEYIAIANARIEAVPNKLL